MDPLTPKEPSPPQINESITNDTPNFDPRELHLPQNPRRPETIYQPTSYVPAKGKQLPPMPLDTDIDTGNPITNYHDLVDIVIRCPNHDELEPPILLSRLVDTFKIARHRLPQQSEIDPLLKKIQTKILQQVHLPTSFHDLKGAYLNSAFFWDIYFYHKTRLHQTPTKEPKFFPKHWITCFSIPYYSRLSKIVSLRNTSYYSVFLRLRLMPCYIISTPL